MTRRSRIPDRLARLALAAGIAIAFAVFGTPVRADGIDDATQAYESGDVARASSMLLDVLLAEPDDARTLLRAVRLAVRMKNLDLVERAQGRIEIAMRDRDDPRDRLALALAYGTLATERLARGMQGPTLAMLFADAEARAREALEVPELAEESRILLARIRWAQGDTDGALDALSALEGPPLTGPAAAQLLRGRLLYDRAVTQRLASDGRPTPEGAADLGRALDALGYVVTHLPLDAGPTDRFDLWMTTAWSAHRLGLVGGAGHAYAEAWRVDPESALPLRGLQSLFAGRDDALVAALTRLAEDDAVAAPALDALAAAQLARGDVEGAVAAAGRRTTLDLEDPDGWAAAGRVLLAAGRADEARAHLVQALRLDPASDVAARLLDATARSYLAEDPERARAVYEELLDLRPDDPYVRNNYGFVLRETVAPYTTVDENGIQRFRPDAPPEIRALLERCVAVYAEAAAAIDDEAELDEQTTWILAGILNDYALMLHYFADVQEPLEAERQYHRALRMTDYGYMDTYLPNLRRLYTTVLPHRHLALYAVAREAQDAILREVRTADGAFGLEPDEAKRKIAAADVRALRTAIYEKLQSDAEDDEADWPPTR